MSIFNLNVFFSKISRDHRCTIAEISLNSDGRRGIAMAINVTTTWTVIIIDELRWSLSKGSKLEF